MAVSEQVERLKKAKAALRTAIESKGSAVPSEALLEEYPSFVEAIPALGDIITETTEELPTYVNQIPISQDVSGGVFNGIGYKPNSVIAMDGSLSSGTSFVSGFIPVKKGDIIRVKDPSSSNFSTGLVFALYNAKKETGSNVGRYINTMQSSAYYGSLTITGDTLTWDTSSIGYYFWREFAYLRVTTNSADSIVTINQEIKVTTQTVKRLNNSVKVGRENLDFDIDAHILSGRKVVVFGDSLIGMTRDKTSVTAYASAYCGAEVINVGFGGCRMSVHPSTGYAAFSMFNIADSIAKNDFSLQIQQAPNGSDYFADQVKVLQGIDFETVDSIVIHYGTNDYAANVQIGSADDISTGTVCGALRYSLQKILKAYPNVKIYVSLPLYRMWNEVGSESYKNALEKTLPEYNDAIRSVANEYNIPVIDGYRNLGINSLNDSAFSTDGTHLNDLGRKRFGEFIGGCLIGCS